MEVNTKAKDGSEKTDDKRLKIKDERMRMEDRSKTFTRQILSRTPQLRAPVLPSRSVLAVWPLPPLARRVKEGSVE